MYILKKEGKKMIKENILDTLEKIDKGSCNIEINKEGKIVSLTIKGDSRIVLATLLSVIYKVKKDYEISDDEFNELLTIISFKEVQNKMEENNEENSSNN